jgi:ElaB/YqjD/DUF883 family membrane-anchored ribosome-binding protein
MSWAQELKSLAENIHSLTAERLRFIRDLERETKDFLKGSEEERLKNFKALEQRVLAEVKRIKKDTAEVRGGARKFMEEVRGDLKELATNLRAFLKASERERTQDFASMMKEIEAALKQMRARVGVVQRDAQDLLKEYGKERAEAASYWASLHKKQEKARAA